MKVYCKSNEYFLVYDGEKFTNFKKRPNGFNELHKDFYDENDDLKQCLKNYHNKLMVWFDEINEGLNLKLKRDWYSSEVKLLYFLFKLFRTDRDVEYDPITYDESVWIENCYKSGLTYGEVGDYDNVNAYDFKKFYSNILGGDNTKKQFPVKAGEPVILKELPEKMKDLQYGIYRVKITSSKENITKIFAFSKAHHYTHEDIQYASFLQKWGFIDKIELIQDGEDNALLYNELINSKDIFGRYVNIINKLALDYPKNKTIKSLLSSLWGRVWTKNTITKMTEDKWVSLSEEEQNKYYCLKVEFEFNHTTKEFDNVLSFVKASSLYKYNIRLQPFITSFARKKMGNQICKYFDDIIRVQTDGVIFRNSEKTKNLQKGLYIKDDKYNNKDIYIKNNKIVEIK